jgi:hypothetical protein
VRATPTGRALGPTIATPDPVLASLWSLCNLRDGDAVYDLGCGDGAVLMSAACKAAVTAGTFRRHAVAVRHSPLSMHCHALMCAPYVNASHISRSVRTAIKRAVPQPSLN